jgi:hypothetical protein
MSTRTQRRGEDGGLVGVCIHVPSVLTAMMESRLSCRLPSASTAPTEGGGAHGLSRVSPQSNARVSRVGEGGVFGALLALAPFLPAGGV